MNWNVIVGVVLGCVGMRNRIVSLARSIAKRLGIVITPRDVKDGVKKG